MNKLSNIEAELKKKHCVYIKERVYGLLRAGECLGPCQTSILELFCQNNHWPQGSVRDI